jgi:hypothetical protein
MVTENKALAKFDATFRRDPVPWKIGEHVAVIGTTGTGKTYLMSRLLDMREYVVMLRTKDDDIKFKGFKRAKNAGAMQHVYSQKLLIEPEYEQQIQVGAKMLDLAYRMGRWTVVLDELYYISVELGLTNPVNKLLTQGRSKRLSIVTGMQRPAWISRFALSEVSHVFTFGLERRDAKILGDSTTQRFVDIAPNLQQYEFAHFHRPTRTITIGNANDLEKVIISPKTLLGKGKQ